MRTSHLRPGWTVLILAAVAYPAACPAGAGEDGLSENIRRAVQALEAAAPEVAQDPTRPGFHLLPPARWMNDVCGAFYYRGWHHVFYQHTPYADQWGTDNGVGWGHARSKDLIHWEHLPPALMPADGRDNRMDASGSAFFDGQGRPVLFFAKTPRSGPREQWAAVPADRPLVRWRRVDIGLAPGQSGVPAGISRAWADMFVFDAEGRVFAIFKSSEGLLVEAQNAELSQWQAVGRIQGVAGECPNLFPLDGRYVLIRSTYPISYGVGDFCVNDFAFRLRGPIRTLDYGYGPTQPGPWSRGLYGTTAFHDAQGRTVLMGWVSGFQEGRGWNGCASLPRVLSLTDDDRLIQTPAPELAALRDRTSAWEGALDNAGRVLPGVSGNMLEVQARFRPGSARTLGLKLRAEGRENAPIALRLADAELDVAGTRVPDALSADGTLKLHLFFDRSVLEVFIDGGRKSVTKVAYPPEGEELVVEAFAEGGAAEILSLAAWTIQSIWDGPRE